MILKPEWLALILSGRKTMELRHQSNETKQEVWLGSKGFLYGLITIHKAEEIRSVAAFQRLAPQHHVVQSSLPYKRTWAIPLSCLQLLEDRVAYDNRPGPIGWRRFRSSPLQRPRWAIGALTLRQGRGGASTRRRSGERSMKKVKTRS